MKDQFIASFGSVIHWVPWNHHQLTPLGQCVAGCDSATRPHPGLDHNRTQGDAGDDTVSLGKGGFTCWKGRHELAQYQATSVHYALNRSALSSSAGLSEALAKNRYGSVWPGIVSGSVDAICQTTHRHESC
jgi:hypothetical protein